MLRKSYNKVSDQLRQQVVDAFEEKIKTIAEIADEFKLKRTTVNSIIKVYKTENRVKKSNNRFRKEPKLNVQQKETIRDWIDEDCTLTHKSIKVRVLRTFGVTVSQATISRVRFHYIYLEYLLMQHFYIFFCRFLKNFVFHSKEKIKF